MWDFIIVGAGTAGSVLADQLTASGRHKVLLVEAGGKPPLMSRIPAGFARLFKSRHDWAFQSQPQAGLDGRTLYIPRGRMLGGSASINAQIHQWCHPADYDGWSAGGASGWSWDEVRPVFRAMEAWAECRDGGQSRGALGPMKVGRRPDTNPLAPAFVAAARASGLDGSPDYNGCAFNGAWLTQQAHHRGCRFSVYDAYLKPAMKRANLAVKTDQEVARIRFAGRRAAGVVLADGSTEPARNVILCAGALGSPHLLMRSGIGPAAHLREHDVEVVHDSPEVGWSLQEHPMCGLVFTTRRPVSLKSADGVGQLLRWLLFRRGPLTSNVVEAMAFTSVFDERAPDLELLLGVVEWQEEGLKPPGRHAYTLGAVAVAPKSRGSVRLAAPSSAAPPAIDYGLLTHPDDAKVMVEGFRLARRIVATEPLKGETLAEAEATADLHEDDELLGYLRGHAQTVYHPTSTCRMGGDSAAVVDPRLKAKGVDRLWVVDASIMPTVPRGHPNAVVAMVAHRAAEWIGAAG